MKRFTAAPVVVLSFLLAPFFAYFSGNAVLGQPSAPILHPIDNADSDHRYTVSWDSIPSSKGYWLAVDSDSNFVKNEVARFTEGSITKANFAFLCKGTYYYRVRAGTNEGVGDWSNVESVTVSEDPTHYMTSSTSVYGENGPRTISSSTWRGYFQPWGIIVTIHEVVVTYDSTQNVYTGDGLSWNAWDDTYGWYSVGTHRLRGGFFGDEYANFSHSSIPSTSVTSKSDALISHYELFQNHPNPFNPETIIKYQLPAISHVRLVIYDALGHEVRQLIDRAQPAGYHSIVWYGQDNEGNLMPSGVYYCRLTSGDFTRTTKMVLVR
jgi:hypothetical protein